jgi:hypothetical protein
MVVALRRAHARAKHRTQEGSIAEDIAVFSKGKAVPSAKKKRHAFAVLFNTEPGT